MSRRSRRKKEQEELKKSPQAAALTVQRRKRENRAPPDRHTRTVTDRDSPVPGDPHTGVGRTGRRSFFGLFFGGPRFVGHEAD